MTIRAITTATELADYPLGSTFTDRQGDVWMINRRNPREAGETCVHMVSPQTNGTHADHVLRKWGPLTPQWRPDRPAQPTVLPTLTAAREAAASAVYPRLYWVDLTEEAQEDMTDAARAILALFTQSTRGDRS